MKEKECKVVYAPEKLKKSNFLISAIYKATTLELKCTFMAMFNVQQGNYQKKADGIYTQLSASMIQKQIGGNRNSLYQRLAKMAQEMSTRTIGMVDEQNETFEFFALINKITYANGKLTIRFPLEMKDYLLNQKDNFTLLPQRVILSFKNAYSIKLYENLRRKCFYSKYYEGEKNYIFAITMNVDELKFNMGIINTENEKVKSIILGSVHPDYSLAIKRSSEKIYNNWRDFKRKIIDTAVKEINENLHSNIKVKYDVVKKGVGGKVTDVCFYVMALEDEYCQSLNRTAREINEFLGYDNVVVGMVKKNAQCGLSNLEQSVQPVLEVAEMQLTEEDKMLIVVEMTTYIKKELAGCELTAKNIIEIAKVAKYDVELIQDAVKAAKETAPKISNIVGWLISCIKNGGYERKEFAENNRAKNCFNNYSQRKYTKEEIAEIERKLLAKNKIRQNS